MSRNIEIRGPANNKAEIFSFKPSILKGDENTLVQLKNALLNPELTEQARSKFNCLECPIFSQLSNNFLKDAIRIFPSKIEKFEAITPIALCHPLLTNNNLFYARRDLPACQDKSITLELEI